MGGMVCGKSCRVNSADGRFSRAIFKVKLNQISDLGTGPGLADIDGT
jgi:hypothetical protein